MRKRVLNYRWATTVALANRSQMPRTSGLYVVRDGKAVLYVGVAIDFRSRWGSHHRRADIEAVTNKARISCFALDHGYARALEPIWFHYLKPSLQRYEWDPVFIRELGCEYRPLSPQSDEVWRFGLQLVEVTAARLTYSQPTPQTEDRRHARRTA